MISNDGDSMHAILAIAGASLVSVNSFLSVTVQCTKLMHWLHQVSYVFFLVSRLSKLASLGN